MPKSRRRPVSTDRRFRRAHENSDYGPPERWQHSGRMLEFTERPGLLAARATEEHVIDILVLRGLLTKTQSAAAFVFKRDYQRAGLASHTTASYTPQRGEADYFRGARDRSDFEEAAYQRWRNAIRALGIRLGAPVMAVACHDTVPAMRDITPLQEGLDKLVDWYRLPRKEGDRG